MFFISDLNESIIEITVKKDNLLSFMGQLDDLVRTMHYHYLVLENNENDQIISLKLLIDRERETQPDQFLNFYNNLFLLS